MVKEAMRLIIWPWTACAKLRDWRLRLRIDATNHNPLTTRPWSWFLAAWIVYGLYGWFKLFKHRAESVPANMAGWYLLGLGTLATAWLLGRHSELAPHWMRLLGVGVSDSVDSRSRVSRADRKTWIWPTVGFLAVVLCLTQLEISERYYFAQDDNLSQFLPVIVQSARGLWRGEFPTWNPHQFAGAPTMSLGTYALTYPPTYLSYAVARHVLGNEWLTFEVFGWLHLLLGYWVTLRLLVRLGIRLRVAVAGSVCYSLSGFLLIAGRSWFYMLPLAVWLPLAATSLAELARGAVSWKWTLKTGLILGVLFHAGNAQMWVYAMMFLVMTTIYLWSFAGRSWRVAIPSLGAIGIAIGIATLLLIPQMLETRNVRRFAYGSGIQSGLFGLFVPSPLSYAETPGTPATLHGERLSELFFFGGVLALAAAPLVISFFVHRWGPKIAAKNVFVPLLAFALICGCGREGVLWFIGTELPFLKSFSQPFKFLAFIQLFGVCVGGVVVERLLRTSRAHEKWELPLVTTCFLLMAYHTTQANASMFNFGFMPYPPLRADLAEAFKKEEAGRVFSIAPVRSGGDRYFDSLIHNFATVTSQYSLEGYDPLISNNPSHLALSKRLKEGETVKTLEALGVRWVIAYKGHDSPPNARDFPYRSPLYFWRPHQKEMAKAVASASDKVFTRTEVTLYRLNPAPLAFFTDQPNDPLTIAFHAHGADIRLPTKASSEAGARQLVLNILPPRFATIAIDGKRSDFRVDEWGRLEVDVPAGANRVDFRYQPPFFACGVLGAFLALSTWVLYLVAAKRFPEAPANGDVESFDRSEQIIPKPHFQAVATHTPSARYETPSIGVE